MPLNLEPGFYFIVFSRPIMEHRLTFLPHLVRPCLPSCPHDVAREATAHIGSTVAVYMISNGHPVNVTAFHWAEPGAEAAAPDHGCWMFGPYTDNDGGRQQLFRCIISPDELGLDSSTHTWMYYHPRIGERSIDGNPGSLSLFLQSYHERTGRNFIDPPPPPPPPPR